jgi:class 3 adenylate cyclase/tetratricopeptide (TPR) repeat protein
MPWCSSCGQFAAEGARFCPACGIALASVVALPQLTRKTVTVLFSDVTGFTALGEQLDPESVHQVMGRFFAEMAGVVERHGGMVEKYIGDEVMALFGLPVVHEDDALRAARAALEMRARLETLNEELASRWDIRLSVHTGLNTGEVAAGVHATGDPVTYGDPVNVAQRLEAAAAPGEILVGATTAQLLRDQARLTALAPLRLKGKPELVEAWRLEDVGPHVRPTATAAPARPFVGRIAQLQLLHETFNAVVQSRRPMLVTLVGPAGIGKSRLAKALLDDAAERATAVTGRCLSYGEGTTYYPLAEIVRRLTERPDEAAIAELAGGGGEGARIASRVARAVGFSRGSVAVEETHWAVRRLLEIQAEKRPLIVVIDDLHWAEPTLLDLIEHLVTSAAGVPLLWLLLGRPELLEQQEGWSDGGASGAVLSLGPLTDHDASALVARLASGTLDSDERELLLATAEGNPFFLEQLVASRAETGSAPARPPPTIQALLAARIDTLPRFEREVIDRAAVEGRNFHRSAVAALLSAVARDGLDTALVALERRELIRRGESELPGETGYRFAHILVREVAYELLPKATRAEFHETYAGWLEDRPGGAYPEIVGYHLEQAYRCHSELRPGAGARPLDLARRAARCLGAAGHAAIDRGDFPGGVNLLKRAIALIPDDEPARGTMLPELGIALVQLGRLAEAEDILTAATERAHAAGEPVAEAHAVTARFFARVQVASESAVAELAERFEELRRAFTDARDELGLARLWRAQALVHWLAGQSTQAEAAWMRAVSRARRVGDEQGIADAMCWLASAACEGPEPVPEAIGRCEAILAELQADRRSQALAMRPLATLHAMAGRLDDARGLLDRANAIFDDLGVEMTSSACHDDALVALLAGDAAGAEAALQSGYAALDEMGERALLATTAAMLARALCLLGNFDEALVFADAAQNAAATDDLSAQILGRTARAQVLAHRGDTSAAEQLSAEAVRIAATTDWLNDHADALMVRAEVLRALGDPAAAEAATQEALDLYERKGNVMGADRARATVMTT